MRLNHLTAHQLNNILLKGEISSVDIVNDVIARIDEVEEKTNCYLRVEKDNMLRDAREADKLIKSGSKAGIFTGIPFGIKDNICTRGINTTCASKILESYTPVYDATVIKKLKDCNYILSGKNNMDEFAMGSSNETSYFGPVKNPWDTTRVPGGSSGGPAACVAADEAICALGSDTGGSIRQPASLCGVVGMKPTYGRVSRYGLIAFASSLDQVGPITKDVEDCAHMLNVICGGDECDSTSIKKEIPDYTDFLKEDIKGMKFGLIKELMVKEISPEIKDSVKNIVNILIEKGAEVEEISLPNLEYALSVYYIIAPSEASSNLSRYDGVRYGYRNMEASTLREMYRKSRSEGFGEEVKRRIMIGTYCLSSGYYDAYYEKALAVKNLIVKDFNDAFKDFDALISPTSPTTAFKIGEKTDDPLMMYLSDICTIPVNLAGLPAISIPVGLCKNGLPIGFQVIGDILREDNVLKTAYSIEKAINFNEKPDL